MENATSAQQESIALSPSPPPTYSSPLFMPFILYQNFISYNMSDLPFGAFCYLRCFFGQLDSIHVHPTLTQKTTTFGIFSIDTTAEFNWAGTFATLPLNKILPRMLCVEGHLNLFNVFSKKRPGTTHSGIFVQFYNK